MQSYPEEEEEGPANDEAAASCLALGQTCVYRPSLAAAPTRSDCCAGASCVFLGNSFSCISNV